MWSIVARRSRCREHGLQQVQRRLALRDDSGGFIGSPRVEVTQNDCRGASAGPLDVVDELLRLEELLESTMVARRSLQLKGEA